MLGTVCKVGLWIAALYAVYSFAQNPAVSNALMLFFTLGIVPGTHIVLTPQQTFIWLGVAFVVTLLLVFGTNIYRGVVWLVGLKQRSRKAHEAIAVGAPGVVIPPQPTGHSVVPVAAPRLGIAPLAVAATIMQLEAPKPRIVVDIKLPRKAGPLVKAFRIVRRPIVLALAAVTLPIAWAVRVVAGGIHTLALRGIAITRVATSRLATQASRTARTVAHVLTVAYWFTLKHVGNAAETTINAAAIAVRIVWTILEPQLRSFDGYLEKRLNQNDIFRGVVGTIADMRRSYESLRLQIRTRMGLSTED